MIRAVGRSSAWAPSAAEASVQSLTKRIWKSAASSACVRRCALSSAPAQHAFRMDVPQYRFQSSSSGSSSAPHPHGPSAQRSRLGIGGAKLAQQSALETYSSVLATSLHSGITTFEAGHGGESNLSNAYQAAMNHLREEDAETVNKIDHITLTARLGYRTVPATSAQDEKDGDDDHLGNYPKDVQVEEAKPGSGGGGGGSNSQAKKGGGDLDEQSDDAHDDMEVLTKSPATDGPSSGDVAVHNLSREYVAHCLTASPLVQLRAEQRLAHSHPDLRLVYLAHNPEAQGAALAGRGAPLDEIRELVKERLTLSLIHI